MNQRNSKFLNNVFCVITDRQNFPENASPIFFVFLRIFSISAPLSPQEMGLRTTTTTMMMTTTPSVACEMRHNDADGAEDDAARGLTFCVGMCLREGATLLSCGQCHKQILE